MNAHSGTLAMAAPWIRIVAVVVMLLSSTVTQADPTSDFERGALEINRVLKGEMKVIAARMDAVAMPRVLGVEQLGSKAAIDACRDKVRRLSALRDERKALLQKHFATLEQYIGQADLGPRDRPRALQGFKDGRDSILRAMEGLEAAERANSRAVDEVLDFAEAHVATNKVSFRNGRFVFDDTSSATQFNALGRQVSSSWGDIRRAKAVVRRAR